MVRLSTSVKPSSNKLTRTFWFSPDGTPGEGFKVVASYLSPAVFAEQGEKAKVKVVSGRRKEGGNFDIVAFKENVARELLVKAIHKIEDCTWRSLRSLVIIEPQIIAANGGPEAVIPMDPDAIGDEDQAAIDAGKLSIDDAKAKSRTLAEDNIVWLLINSGEFFDWAMKVVSGLEYYQDDEWEDQIENMKSVG